VTYERIEVPWTKARAWQPKPDLLLGANPRAEVPVLLDGSITLWDSTVINEYLEEKYPSTRLLPQDLKQRALCRLWEDEGDHNQAHVGVLIRDVFLAPEGAALTPEAQHALQQLQAFFRRLDAQLGDQPYVCGDYSLADISSFLTVAFAITLGATIAEKRVQRWYESMQDREAVRTEFSAIMTGVAAL